MPTAIVTGGPERVPDIAIALKAAGFDILAGGDLSAGDVPDLEPGSVDCYVQLPADRPRLDGGPLQAATALIAREVVGRCDAAAGLLALLAPGARVLLVVDGAEPGWEPGRNDLEGEAVARMVGLLAQAIARDSGPAGVRTAVVDDHRTTEEIAGLAGAGPPEPHPWWVYADVDLDLDFADWRTSILSLASSRDG